MRNIKIQVPARVCFFGDHQDYLGLPVIAGTINKYLTLSAKPIDRPFFEIQLPDLGQRLSISIKNTVEEKPPADYFESGIRHLRKQGAQFSQGYAIDIHSEIPINAGLSSSSALVVSWLRFLCLVGNDFEPPQPKTLGHWAYEVEVLAFNQPGGLMDQYTIAQGGLLFIDTDSQQSQALRVPPFDWVIAESGVAKKTLTVLAQAREKQQKALAVVQGHQSQFDLKKSTQNDYDRYVNLLPPDLRPYWYATIHNYALTRQAFSSFQSKPDIYEIGQMMQAHQHILADHIHNTPVALKKMLKSAQNAGALGSKIIGSGGGGCMVALVEAETRQAVIDAFLVAGAQKAYPVQITAATHG